MGESLRPAVGNYEALRTAVGPKESMRSAGSSAPEEQLTSTAVQWIVGHPPPPFCDIRGQQAVAGIGYVGCATVGVDLGIR